MRLIHSSMFAIALLALPLTATAERSVTSQGDARPELSVDAIVNKHVAALGGEKLLRGTKVFTFTVSGEKMGKKFTKVVTQARPNKLRVDIQSDDGPMSKGFDGKVAWTKKGSDKAIALTPDETKGMASHSEFDEPLLDYAKKGTKVKLVGKADVKGTLAYDLELTLKNGDVEHHFLDASTFLLFQKTFTGKDKDGKAKAMTVRFGDYKKVQGRMVNHSVEWDGDDGKAYKSAVSAVAYDRKIDQSIFAMPK
jgi:hypothetical protein